MHTKTLQIDPQLQTQRDSDPLRGKKVLLALLSIVFLHGCSSPSLSGPPITDGFHRKLPLPETRTIVWGSNKGAVQHITTWLLKNGLTVVDQTKLLQYSQDHEVRLSHSHNRESDVLRMGKGVGAQLVIFVTTKIASGENVVFQGGLPTKQAVHNGAVFIRAVDVETGEINWSGTARYLDDFQNFDEGITRLSCYALASAWGLQPKETAQESGSCDIVADTNPRTVSSHVNSGRAPLP